MLSNSQINWPVSIILLLLFFVQCERSQDLDFDIPFEGGKMVVYSSLTTDGKLEVAVYKSEPALYSAPFNPLTEVTGNLIDQDGIRQPINLQFNPGNYHLLIDQNRNYRLELFSKDLAVSSTEVGFPVQVPIKDVKLSFTPDSASLEIQFTFSDARNHEDYYAYKVQLKAGTHLLDTQGSGFSSTFSDEGFPGEDYTITISSSARQGLFDENYNLVGVLKADHAVIKLYHVSPEVYKFYESLRHSENTLGASFADQQPIYSNIKGGYGFFGTIAVDSLEIRW